MPTIDQFKNRLLMGGARPNHFSIQITIPTSVPAVLDDKHTYLCKAGSLPASTVIDIPVMYRGREVHFAGERTFAPWTTTIINELDFNVRAPLEAWMNYIQQNSSTTGEETYSSYQGSIIVRQLSRDWSSNDKVMRSYKLFNAYPIEVGEIALSYDIPNAVEEFPVTFVYDWFEPYAGEPAATGTTTITAGVTITV